MKADERAETLDIRPCPVCGRENPVDASFCGGCGQSLIDSANEIPDVADPLVGRIIADRYRIVELLGRGGMGVVYKVEHVHIGKLMAMKLLHGELARDRNTVKRFQREADAVSRLNHANTVQVFDFGRSEGLMYLVMEYLNGKDLGQLVREEGHLDFKRVARICAQVCASVHEAHLQGIVHRDLKPENVMILEDGREIAKVLDFGLAKLRDHTGGITVTRAGAIVGTPYYMPPEQIRGEEVDPRGDVYAIGAMLYKACTGVPPYVANTPMGVLTKHLTEPLVPPSRRSGFHLPPEADAIVGRAMQKDPSDRYPSADGLRQELLAYLSDLAGGISDSAIRSGQVAAPVDNAFATRKDVDNYEKRLRRRGFFAYGLMALLLVGGAIGGWKAWQTYQSSPKIPTAETEPNNEPEQANALPPGVEITGFIGQRQSEELGDVDLYAIRNDTGQRKLLRAEVSALPNIDLVIDVVRVGQRNPILSADSGGVRIPEVIPNFPLAGSDYLLRVRERWITGMFPTENVSDAYTISWELSDAEDGWEEEVNDSLELANEVGVAAEVRGYVGWAGDVDTFCFTEAAPAVDVRLSGVEGLNVVLREVDRVRASSRKTDAAGIGEPESTRIQGVEGGRTCVEVSAEENETRRANPAAAYTLTFRPAEVETP